MRGIRNLCTAVLLFGLAANAGAQPDRLTVAWEYPTPGLSPQAMLWDGLGRGFLYVALKNGGLSVLDVSRPDLAPTRVASVGTTSFKGLHVMHLTQQKELLYLALGDFFDSKGSPAGLGIVNVADPRKPRVVGVWATEERLRGAAAVQIRGRYAYLGAMTSGIFILDVSDPARISQAAEILPDVDFPRKKPGKTQHPNARGLVLRGRYLYVAFDSGGLRIIDVADPLKPREIGRYLNPGMLKKQAAYNNLVLHGDTAYVATDYAGMEVLDIGDPRSIRLISWWNPWKADTLRNVWFNSPGHTNQIEYDASRHRVYLSGGDSDLRVLDVSSPGRPRLVGRYGEPGDRRGTWGLTLAPHHVCLAYITAVVPYHGTWSGIKAVTR